MARIFQMREGWNVMGGFSSELRDGKFTITCNLVHSNGGQIEWEGPLVAPPDLIVDGRLKIQHGDDKTLQRIAVHSIRELGGLEVNDPL